MTVDALFRLYAPDECTGREGYPPVWHESIKHLVRELAGHRCVRCLHPFKVGETPGEWSPCDSRCDHDGLFRAWSEYGDPIPLEGEASTALELLRCGEASRVETYYRVLTVHHLDGVKGNCRWWNLASLCQRCHLTIQGKVVMDRRWLHEHSDWFKPYVAGYYAHCYLGEDLTRDEAEARMGELLALEHRQESLA